jgi:ribosomal-protein-alanine N-acetyltransferase
LTVRRQREVLPTPEAAPLHLRHIVRADLGEIAKLQRAAFGEAGWTKKEIWTCLSRIDCDGYAAEREQTIVGHTLCLFDADHVQILTLAVAEQRCGIGARLIARLIDKPSVKRRGAIVADVPETNLAAQLFFRSLGFRATGVLRRYFTDTGEDAYPMRYEIVA